MPIYKLYWYAVKPKNSDVEILAPTVVHNDRAFIYDGGLIETSVVCISLSYTLNDF